MRLPSWIGLCAAVVLAPGAAAAAAGPYAYTLLDASQALEPGGVVLFATAPKVVGDQATLDLVMAFVVPAPDPSVGGAIISHVIMPMQFSCSTRQAKQLQPTIVDTGGQAVTTPAGQWPQEGPVPYPEPGVFEPAFEAYRLACGQRIVTKTFPSLGAVLNFAHNAAAAPLLAPP